MILTRYPLDNYPLSYRRAAYEPLLEAIKARKSVYLASLTGMGKTHLLKFLAYRRDLHQHAFGSGADNLLFVLVDFHSVGDLAGLYTTFLAETYRHLGLPAVETPESGVPAAIVGELTAALLQHTMGPSAFVFIFDGLEMLFPVEAELEAFLKQLRTLRDNLGGAVSFILGAKPPLPDIETLGGNFAYLLDDPPLVWLPLLTEEEVSLMAAALQEQLELAVDLDRGRPLFEYVGGHPRLLKECLLQWHRGRISLEAPAADWRRALQGSAIVQRLCQQIWADLPAIDQALLQALARGGHPTGEVAGSVVHRVGLVTGGAAGRAAWRIASPLLADFVRTLRVSEPARPAVDWVDDITLHYHELRYRTLPAIPLRPKEYDVMNLLVQARGEVVERQDLIDAAWPNEVETEVFEDNNLNTVISGLRGKLRKEKYPLKIRNIRKRGYQLASTG